MFQMLIKACTLIYYKNNFVGIIKTDLYWPLSIGDEQTEEKVSKYLYYSGKLIRIILFWYGSTIASFLVKIYLYDAFIILVWIPNYGIFNFTFVKYLELSYITFGGLTVIAFDLLYVCVALKLIVQFRLLINKMRTINVYDEKKNIKLKVIVQQHNYLLRWCKLTF